MRLMKTLNTSAKLSAVRNRATMKLANRHPYRFGCGIVVRVGLLLGVAELIASLHSADPESAFSGTLFQGLANAFWTTQFTLLLPFTLVVIWIALTSIAANVFGFRMKSGFFWLIVGGVAFSLATTGIGWTVFHRALETDLSFPLMATISGLSIVMALFMTRDQLEFP
ncbi:hypothetical protein [Litorisediminicola beolgyonensis]|uniref:Uncharacterized protein n=1 Tax=Litorisediminicola beolgyonensis TaxID=1173614 RepID=A0ABW3ZLM4_9RHOB